MPDSNVKKIVYVMNVEWNWIKQRPHFIAECLSEDYDIHIVYRYKYNRKGLQHRSEKELKLYPVKVIPGISRIRNLKWINDFLLARRVRKIIRDVNPDCLYFTYPSQVNMIPSDFNGKIIYDCMDNHSAFITDPKEAKELEKKEKRLVEASDNVLVSSEYLERTIAGRYDADESKFVLVRNAYDGKILDNPKGKKISSTFRMAYVGTISSWFDWNTILSVLAKSPHVELHLYGPVERGINIPKHERIYYHGTVEHDRLYETIKDMDCLVMPFVVNELIKAVDPVKIYEYINFNKDIIMCRYDEVERFDDFVYFYRSAEEFTDVIENIMKDGNLKYSEKMRRDFLMHNTWKDRKKQIVRIISEHT